MIKKSLGMTFISLSVSMYKEWDNCMSAYAQLFCIPCRLCKWMELFSFASIIAHNYTH